MIPTEADIQAELIEGWEILYEGAGAITNGGWMCISKCTLEVTVYNGPAQKVKFAKADHEIDIKFPDFLTGNYDLSAISQHYSPEEWQRIISMCERIVRLITGDYPVKTLEEKVREILEPLGIRISDLKVSDQRAEFHAGVIRYSITSDTITREGYEFTLNEYKESRLNEDFRQCLPKVAALLTPSDQPEQTLEEAVRGHLSGMKYRSLNVREDRVCFFELTEFDRPTLYLIEKDKICFEDEDEWKEYPPAEFLSKYGDGPEINRVPLEIAALLSTRSTKPSYSDLEQRVEELEKIQRNLNQEVSSWMNKFLHEEKTTSDLRKEKSELERENASLLDKFGPIDQVEQQVAEVETRFQKLAKKAERIADIMLQLNEEIL